MGQKGHGHPSRHSALERLSHLLQTNLCLSHISNDFLFIPETNFLLFFFFFSVCASSIFLLPKMITGALNPKPTQFA